MIPVQEMGNLYVSSKQKLNKKASQLTDSVEDK